MQVSWIDPDELARLAAELNGPLPGAEPSVSWDLNTMPELTADALMSEVVPAPPSPPAPSQPAPVPPAMAPHPELDHIREKLRAIRSRAQDAGLLPKNEAPAPAVAPAPPSAAPAAPEPVPTAPAPESRPWQHGPPLPVSAPVPEPPAAAAPDAVTTTHAFLNLDGSLTERLASFMTWAERYAPSKEILLVDDHGELLWGNPSHPELALSAVLAANVSLRSGAQSLSQQPAATVKLSEDKQLTVLPCVTRLGLVTLALLNAAPTPSDEQISCLREALTLSVEGRS